MSVDQWHVHVTDRNAEPVVDEWVSAAGPYAALMQVVLAYMDNELDDEAKEGNEP